MAHQKHQFLQVQSRQCQQGLHQNPTKDSISIELNLVMTFLSITDLGDKHALALLRTNKYLSLNNNSSVIVLFGEHVGLNWV